MANQLPKTHATCDLGTNAILRYEFGFSISAVTTSDFFNLKEGENLFRTEYAGISVMNHLGKSTFFPYTASHVKENNQYGYVCIPLPIGFGQFLNITFLVKIGQIFK